MEDVTGATQSVSEVSGTGRVVNGRIVGIDGEDFYSHIAAFEGKTIVWSMKVVEPQP